MPAHEAEALEVPGRGGDGDGIPGSGGLERVVLLDDRGARVGSSEPLPPSLACLLACLLARLCTVCSLRCLALPCLTPLLVLTTTLTAMV